MEQIHDANCLDCQYISEPSKVLSVSELQLLKKNCDTISFGKGELICKQGTPVTHIIYIRIGFVKICYRNSNNKSIIIKLSKSFDYIGLFCLFGSNNYVCSAVALEPTQVCYIPKECFTQLMDNNGLFSRKIIEYNSKKELLSNKRIYSLIHKQVPGRLADLLLYFAREIYNNKILVLPLSRNELADFVGTSKKSFIRTLMEFRNDGFIKIEGRQIEIVRIDLLEKLSKVG